MTPGLSCDFETRSVVDLQAAGQDNYSRHPTTDAWCMSFRFDAEPVRRWTRGTPLPTDVAEHVRAGKIVKAWNAPFELAIWNNVMRPRYGWPELKVEQCRCTMARSYAAAMPGKLERAAPALGITQQKDMVGHRLMLQMCRPREIKPDGTIVWWDEPDKIERLGQYCDADVLTESAADERLMPLSDSEQRLWVLDQVVNQRGIFVDLPVVNAAIGVVIAERDRLNEQMREVTKNYVGFCTETARLKQYVLARGVAVSGVAKGDIVEALDNPDLPDDVRAALLLRQQAGKSSTSKLQAMISAASADGRLRGMFQYHGAGTGRWAGRRVQLHNVPTPKIKQSEIERAIAFMAGEA